MRVQSEKAANGIHYFYGHRKAATPRCPAECYGFLANSEMLPPYKLQNPEVSVFVVVGSEMVFSSVRTGLHFVAGGFFFPFRTSVIKSCK
jgi:hypothetical protein